MCSDRLNELLGIIDATPYIGHDAIQRIIRLLCKAGRYREAGILHHLSGYAIRQLSCGHRHIRRIGEPFDLADLGPPCSDAEEVE